MKKRLFIAMIMGLAFTPAAFAGVRVAADPNVYNCNQDGYYWDAEVGHLAPCSVISPGLDQDVNLSEHDLQAKKDADLKELQETAPCLANNLRRREAHTAAIRIGNPTHGAGTSGIADDLTN